MTIEDYLDIIANRGIEIPKGDAKLINSLHRQITRCQGLTIRQHELLKRKLLEYKPLLIDRYPDFEFDLDNLRRPYREIDRSKSVSIAAKDRPAVPGTESFAVIAIRFPYSNRMVKHINYIKKSRYWNGYEQKSKTHFVTFTDENVDRIVTYFKDLNFVIEDRLMDYYNALQVFKNDPHTYEPGIYNYEIKNVHESSYESAIKQLGPPTQNNLYLYADRKEEFGLSHFDEVALENSLADKTCLTKRIISRNYKNVFVANNKYSYAHIIKSIQELYRLPLLIVTGHRVTYSYTSQTQMHQEVDSIKAIDTGLLEALHKVLLKTFGSLDISVLYRKDKRDLFDIDFNAFIADNNLNSPLTKDTDVVIVNQNKRLPKPLIESGWMPNAVMTVGASYAMNKSVSHFVNYAPLILSFDTIHLYTNKDFFHA